MAGFTNKFFMAYFDFGDRLDYAINVNREIDRFVMIDRQLQGLYSIFDDGVISGWEVFDNGFSSTSGISLGITTGLGIISSISSQTTAITIVDTVQPSSTLGVYAYNIGASPVNRFVQFYVGSNAPNSNAILIARVITSDNGISSIDNTVRNYINFEQISVDLINSHKHRGTPPKVNLSTETKNELSGARVENFDANKITSGKIDHSFSPVIKHSDLTEKGVLTHAQLESLADAIINYNDLNNLTFNDLMGEIACVNLLQQTIFLKYLYTDVDKYYNNEFVIIPGISTDSMLDEEHSTAYIDKIDHRIVGLPLGPTNPTYFFTENVVLPSEVKDIILTANKSVPVNSSITFGVNTTNSVNFEDYQVIDEAKLETVNYNGMGIRVGIKFIYLGPFDPFSSATQTFQEYIDFAFLNDSGVTKDFHFRVRWYTDAGTTILFYTANSIIDQEKWVVNDDENIPIAGYPVVDGETITISYFPDLTEFSPYQIYYVLIDAWNGSAWVSQSGPYSYFTTQGSSTPDPYSYLPQVYNFGVMFSLLDNSKVQVNI